MGDPNDPMLKKTDLSGEGNIQHQKRPIRELDKEKTQVVFDNLNKDIQEADGDTKLIVSAVMKSVGSILKMALGMFLVVIFLCACGSKRPQGVINANKFKTSLFNEVESDWNVRREAGYTGMKVRGEKKISANTELNLSATRDNLKMIEGEDGKVRPFVVIMVEQNDGSYKEMKRPLNEYINNCIALRDKEKEDLKSLVEKERAEDAKIAEKFEVIRALSILEEKYHRKKESGTLTTEDVQGFFDEAMAIAGPYLMKRKSE